jgi:hypothetical protein
MTKDLALGDCLLLKKSSLQQKNHSSLPISFTVSWVTAAQKITAIRQEFHLLQVACCCIFTSATCIFNSYFQIRMPFVQKLKVDITETLNMNQLRSAELVS